MDFRKSINESALHLLKTNLEMKKLRIIFRIQNTLEILKNTILLVFNI